MSAVRAVGFGKVSRAMASQHRHWLENTEEGGIGGIKGVRDEGLTDLHRDTQSSVFPEPFVWGKNITTKQKGGGGSGDWRRVSLETHMQSGGIPKRHPAEWGRRTKGRTTEGRDREPRESCRRSVARRHSHCGRRQQWSPAIEGSPCKETTNTNISFLEGASGGVGSEWLGVEEAGVSLATVHERTGN